MATHTGTPMTIKSISNMHTIKAITGELTLLKDKFKGEWHPPAKALPFSCKMTGRVIGRFFKTCVKVFLLPDDMPAGRQLLTIGKMHAARFVRLGFASSTIFRISPCHQASSYSATASQAGAIAALNSSMFTSDTVIPLSFSFWI